MEMPMKGFKDQPSPDPTMQSLMLRMINCVFTLYPRSVQRTAQDTSKNSSWKIVSAENISNFSATAYYFGRLLSAHLKVPVALIADSYGGSPAEAFMSRESLSAFPGISLPNLSGNENLVIKMQRLYIMV
jgi:sialate O-acetylesterase